MQGRDQPLQHGPRCLNCCLRQLASETMSQSDSVQTHLSITESIESDMLSHDRHATLHPRVHPPMITVPHRTPIPTPKRIEVTIRRRENDS